MIKEWRHKDWIKYIQKRQGDMKTANLKFSPIDFDAGASAMLFALLKWLDEPCREHRTKWRNPNLITYPSHRKDCPKCMAELRGEK